jgi:hypothetical protein
VTPALKRLLETTIDSFEKLEIVRCIWAPEAALVSTIDQIAERAGTTRGHLLPSLAELVAADVVGAAPDGGVYALRAGSAHDEQVRELLDLYANDPLAIIRVINAIAVQRMRTLAARAFSDSFLLRRPKKPG